MIPTPAKSAAEGADTAEVAAAQAQAEAIEKKLAAGAKFDDLAKPAPTDPNAPKSVVLGEFRRGMLAKEIEDKAFALNAGQHTQPIRTKQGFIILQATQHNPGGEASFKQVEPQVEEALFLERMQPKLREYLTKLREEAAIDIKPGVVDTGASGNEMKLTYSAYTPPAPEEEKEICQRSRFRGRNRLQVRVQTQAQTTAAPRRGRRNCPCRHHGSQRPQHRPPPPPLPAAAKPSPRNRPATTTRTSRSQASGRRFALGRLLASLFLPRKSRPRLAPDAGPSVTTPETRYVNPDGTVSSSIDCGARTQDPPEHPAAGAQGKDSEARSGYPRPADSRRTGIAEGAERAPGADRPERGQKAQAEGRKDPLLRQAEGAGQHPALSRQTGVCPAGCPRRQASRPYPAHRLRSSGARRNPKAK